MSLSNRTVQEKGGTEIAVQDTLRGKRYEGKQLDAEPNGMCPRPRACDTGMYSDISGKRVREREGIKCRVWCVCAREAFKFKTTSERPLRAESDDRNFGCWRKRGKVQRPEEMSSRLTSGIRRRSIHLHKTVVS